jgi:hypothetical protein
LALVVRVFVIAPPPGVETEVINRAHLSLRLLFCDELGDRVMRDEATTTDAKAPKLTGSAKLLGF